MKKILMLMGGISLLSIVACSSDDDSSNSSSSDPVVKRILYQDEDPDGYNYDVTYSYNGNKITQGVYTDGYVEKYYYSGDRIVKIEYLTDGEVEEQDVFTYDASGMLTQASYQDLIGDYEERTTYATASANTVTQTYYSGEIGNNTPDWTATLTITDGEVTQSTHIGTTYTYDTKNSPFKNVTGWAAIAHANAGDHELEGSKHNIISIQNNTTSPNYTTNTYTYNAGDYPLTATSVSIFDADFPTDVSTVNVQYFYE
jgi:major membrane immunogen (membrane-anchored lipoprotein)